MTALRHHVQSRWRKLHSPEQGLTLVGKINFLPDGGHRAHHDGAHSYVICPIIRVRRMGIIDGRAPRPVEEDTPRQVVIKLREGVSPHETERALAQLGRPGGKARALAAEVGSLTFAPYVSERDLGAPEGEGGDASVRVRGAGEQSARSKGWGELRRYLAADLPPGADPLAVSEALAELEEVESAYVAGGPTPPPVNAADDPRAMNQGYLDAAPGGIDARFAWGRTDGLAVGVVDLEQG